MNYHENIWLFLRVVFYSFNAVSQNEDISSIQLSVIPFFILTEVDGKNLDSMSERILMVATKDLKTGRLHVKGLESIEIKKNKL